MIKFKKYLSMTAIWLVALLVYLLLLTFFNYSGFLKFQSIATINFIITSLITFVLGIINGKSSVQKGYIEGLKLGSIIVLIFGIINLLFYRHFNLNVFLYYFVILLSSTIGSVVGINFANEKK